MFSMWVNKSSVEISQAQKKSVEFFNDPKFNGHPLLGIYNKKTQEVILYPCIKEKVRVCYEKNNFGKIIVGTYVEDNKKVLTPEEMDRYSKNKYVPRFYYDDIGNEYTGHEYLLKLMNIIDKSDYAGFSVTPGDKPEFIWISGTLNSPVGSYEYGAEVPIEIQAKITQIILSWKPSERSLCRIL